jgi:hypothetical protein
MKKQITLFAIANFIALNILSQPVLNYSPTHSIGTEGNIYLIPGAPSQLQLTGANINWDFSTLNLTQVGTFGMIDPSQTSYFSQFPNANLSFNQNLLSGQTYAMLLDSPTELSVIASDLGSSSEDIYASGFYDKLANYPFNFNDSFTHTRQEVGGVPEQFTRVYDAYGTLTINGTSWNNVIRIKKIDGNALWFITSPVMYPVIIQSSNTYVYNEPATFTKIGALQKNDIIMYPNPAAEITTIQSDNLVNSRVIVTDLRGKVVFEEICNQTFLNIHLDKFSSGLYSVSIIKNQEIIHSKLQVVH